MAGSSARTDSTATVIRTPARARPRRAFLRVLVACGFAALPMPSDAQVFRGEVVDEAGTALGGVAVGLFGPGRDPVASAVSDDDGSFSVTAPAAGSWRVHFTRAGYRSVSGGPYDLDPAEPLEATVVLHRAPRALPGIEAAVEGESRRLRLAGFYERRGEGFGHFIDRDRIERRGAVRMVDLLDPLPNISVDHGVALTGPEQVRNPPIWFGRAGQRCVPALWIDGTLVRTGGFAAEPLRPDDFVWPLDVEGIEFYGGPAQVPIEFSRSAGCAVLVVWTRDPESGGS